METKAKKKWKTPHTFVILVVIILIAAAATYIVPAGEFTRFKDAATGKTLVEAGSYHRIASSPLNPLKIPSAIYTGIVKISVNNHIYADNRRSFSGNYINRRTYSVMQEVI